MVAILVVSLPTMLVRFSGPMKAVPTGPDEYALTYSEPWMDIVRLKGVRNDLGPFSRYRPVSL